MAIDALTISFQWTNFTGTATNYPFAWVTLGPRGYPNTEANTIRAQVQMTTPGDGSDSAKLDLDVNGATSHISIPYTGALWGSFPDLDLQVYFYRAMVAGLAYGRAGLVETNFGLSCQVDFPLALWPAHDSLIVEFLPAGTSTAQHDVLPYGAATPGISAPWPVESWSTAAVTTVGGARLDGANYLRMKPASPFSSTRRRLAICPPCERGLARTRDGAEVISRRRNSDNGTADVGLVDVWRRTGPAAAWSLDATITAAGGTQPAVYPLNLSAWPAGNWTGSISTAAKSYDNGATWTAGPTDSYGHQAVMTDWLSDPCDGLWRSVGLYWAGSTEAVAVIGSGLSTTTVATNCRAGSDTYVLPHPFIYRRRDGRWLVGWFLGSSYEERVSDDLLGSSWTDNGGAANWTGDAGAAYMTGFWKGRDGREAVAGYHFADEAFYVLTRGGEGEAWTGPYLSVAGSTAAAPYIVERLDGLWEAGWLVNGTWTKYTATAPFETWSAA